MRLAVLLLLTLGCAGGEQDPADDAGDSGGADDAAACDDPVAWYRDFDGDGYGSPARHEEGCEPPEAEGWVQRAGDCDDAEPTVNPSRPDDDCDRVDNDCDGTVDPVRDVFHDLDGDGFGGEHAGTTCWDLQPDDPRVYIDGDCDDDNAAVYPGQVEWYGDAVDSDCDGVLEGECGEGTEAVEMEQNDPNAVTDTIHPVAWFTGDGGICSMDCGDEEATADEVTWWAAGIGCGGEAVDLPVSPGLHGGITLCATNAVEGERFTMRCEVQTDDGLVVPRAGSYPAR